MAASNYLESAVLNHLFRTATLAKPTNVWAVLYSSNPTDADSGTEITTGGIGRVQIPVADAQFTAPADNAGSQQITNVNAISFGPSTGAAANATHIGIRDAATGGNLLLHGALNPAQNITGANQTVTIPAGSLALRFG